MDAFAPLLITLLVVLALVAGSAWSGAPRWLRWFGRLPGDVRIEREGFTLLLPMASMIVVSLVLSLLLAGLNPLLGVLGKVFGWFGRLPGDVRIRRDGFALFVPVRSMVISSVLLTLVAGLVRWLGGRGDEDREGDER